MDIQEAIREIDMQLRFAANLSNLKRERLEGAREALQWIQQGKDSSFLDLLTNCGQATTEAYDSAEA